MDGDTAATRLLQDRRSRPLSAAQQQSLVAAYRTTRDPKLEQRLVEANLRLVVKLALEHDRTGGRYLEDLVQEGTLGLIEGIRRFDPAKGARLTTYAAFWIRAFIMRHVMDNVRVVRVVRTRAERAAFFRGQVGAVEVPFDARGAHDDRPLEEVVPDPAPLVDEVVETAELVQRVRQEADRLERRLAKRDVVILRERLLADEPKPRRQVGRRVSLSGERVRQIEGNLRAALHDGLAAAA